MPSSSYPEVKQNKSSFRCVSRTKALILLAFFSLLLPAHSGRLAAQTTSTVLGRITDPQGLAIAGATLTLSGAELPDVITITSDTAGSYRIAGLQAGTYNLRASKPGFAAKVYEGLTVTVNESLVFNVALPVSTMRQAITVSAKPALLEASDSSSGATILPHEIEQMPINGRNYLDLMQLVPGVTVNRQEDPGTDSSSSICSIERIRRPWNSTSRCLYRWANRYRSFLDAKGKWD